MGKQGRPNKNEAVVLKKRDEDIITMKEKGYPLNYIASFYGLTKPRIVQILSKVGEEIDKNEPTP